MHAPLAAWIAEHLAAAEPAVSNVELGSLERPAGGRSHDTLLVDASWVADRTLHRARWAVRVQPMTGAIFRQPDVVREARVLAGLAATPVPAPRVVWVEPDPCTLGAPFFVMDAVEGRVPLARPSIHSAGWLPAMDVEDRATLWRSAIDTVCAVHAVDWASSHAFLLDDTDGSVRAYVERITSWYGWTASGRAFPITDAAAEYVLERIGSVATSEPVLVWGDARVGNMIFGDDHRVVAAIDWETATIGPAEADVAHWLFFDEFATSAVGVEPLAGWPSRDEVVSAYEERTGRVLHDLDLFQAVDELFMAGTLIRQADARVFRGLAPADTRMGHDNTITQMLARRLGLRVPELSPDYVAHRGGDQR